MNPLQEWASCWVGDHLHPFHIQIPPARWWRGAPAFIGWTYLGAKRARNVRGLYVRGGDRAYGFALGGWS